MQNGGVTLWFAAPALGALMFAAPATAQDYPTRPIRMVVPQAAGSASDTVARIIAGELTTRLKQQVIVDNRPGGALQLGLEIAAKSPPDGYTIAYGMIGALAISPSMEKVPYETLKDLQPITLVATVPEIEWADQPESNEPLPAPAVPGPESAEPLSAPSEAPPAPEPAR